MSNHRNLPRTAGLFTFIALFLCCSAAALPDHPRLLVTEQDWKELPSRARKEPIVREIMRATIVRADDALEAPQLSYSLRGKRLLAVSRQALNRIVHLGAAYKMTGEKKYLKRCTEELLTVSAFKDWNPSHHLDTAEMQAAVAIGYDWLYQDLSPDDRKTIGRALLQKGLKETFSDKSLQKKTNNWNQVCMGGMVLSAIALMDIEPTLCKKALAEARPAILFGLKESYPPDGAYGEGGEYWAYGTEYAILAIEALRSAELPDAAIASQPGFLHSGVYMQSLHGTSGVTFNYGDSNPLKITPSPGMVWMARENQSASMFEFAAAPFEKVHDKYVNNLLALAAFWTPTSRELKKDKAPLHFLGTGNSPIALHRTGYLEKDLFLGIKAGSAGVPHGHMDAGSFVIDWEGKRWAEDLGKQDYGSLEKEGLKIWNMEQESDRWKVFRLKNQTHNTLTYNNRQHLIDGEAKIISSEGGSTNKTLVDMAAPLGLGKRGRATRQFEMDGRGGLITITDSLSGLKSGDTITWHMITRAKVSGKGSGLSLEQDRERIALSVSSSQGDSPRFASADPPDSNFDAPNPGMTRIFFEATAGKDGKVEIRAEFKGFK